MVMGMGAVDKGLDILNKGASILDENINSEAKVQAARTERLRIDSTSPFRLPHLIRPMAFIWAMALQTILSILAIVMAFMADPVDTTSILAVIGSQTSILIAIVGFYFNSRKIEKVNAKKAMAEIEISKDRAKVDIIRDKDKLRMASKMAGLEFEEEKAETKLEIKEDKKKARQDRRAARKEGDSTSE